MADETPHRLDWEQLLDEALTASGSTQGIYDRFYPYSFLNRIFLRMQGVHEPVATYARWKALGRQVLKGSKAKEIIRPILVHVQHGEHEDGKGGEEREPEDRVIGFKPVRCIFTVSETEGADPPPPMQLPAWDLHAALNTLGIRQVPFDELNGNVQGYLSGVEIAISPVAVHPEKTLFHELGHVVLGHTLPHALGAYQAHRGIMEFQAESMAYLTMHELGLLDEQSAGASRGYIQEWLDHERPPDQAIQQVFTATDRILKAGRLAVAANEAECLLSGVKPGARNVRLTFLAHKRQVVVDRIHRALAAGGGGVHVFLQALETKVPRLRHV
jgi:hypothetical protein